MRADTLGKATERIIPLDPDSYTSDDIREVYIAWGPDRNRPVASPGSTAIINQAGMPAGRSGRKVTIVDLIGYLVAGPLAAAIRGSEQTHGTLA